MSAPDPLRASAQAALDLAARQLRRLVTNHPDHFPLYTEGGKWLHGGAAWTNWCEGFLPGQLWLIHQQTGDPWFRERAIHYCRLIEHRKTDTSVHDLGFLFWSSWKRWYDQDGDEARRRVLIEAGQTAGSRFREQGAYLPSFVGPQSLFIDIMMNIGIIFYAARETGDNDLLRRVTQHCLTTRRYLVRGDGSTAHEGIFDTETGEFLRQSTHQGWRGDSLWARGLTWALYGFGTAYSFSGDARFLQTAEACAACYLEHTPAHGVPPNDWLEPAPQHPYESSAAAIAASGFQQLATLTADPLRARLYRDSARQILTTLCAPPFLIRADDGYEGILRCGMYHERHGLGVNQSVMWGDHFFLEALCHYLNE